MRIGCGRSRPRPHSLSFRSVLESRNAAPARERGTFPVRRLHARVGQRERRLARERCGDRLGGVRARRPHRAALPEGACLECQLGALEIVNELDAGGSAHASRPDPDGLASRSDDDDLLSAQDIEKHDKCTDESTNQKRYSSHTLAGELKGPEPHNRR